MYMNSKQYEIEASRTMSNEWHLDLFDQTEMHCAIGICTEVGELVEAINGRSLDLINIMEECGDIFWYLSGFCRKFDFELNDNEVNSDVAHDSLSDAILDLVMYSTRLLDIYKKHTFYGSKLDENNILSLCFEIFSICTQVLSSIGYSVSEARCTNIEKLSTRFPEKFTSSNANNRNLTAERGILEGNNIE